MAEILDIIQNLTFNVQGEGLQQALTGINQNIQAIATMANRVSQLQQAYNRTSATEVERRQRILRLINEQRAAVDRQTAAVANEVRQNRQLQQAIQQEIGLINTLQMRQRALTEERNRSNDPRQIAAFNRELAQTNRELSRLTGQGGKGIFSQVLQGIGIGGGIGIAGFVGSALSGIKGLIQESSALAAETEGVQVAFNRLNQPDLLQNLRDATKGTVSDLELMKNAIQFSNFGLPIDKLGTALSFARVRAAETGQSVDYLVQSIVTGIGRQSPLILDNLGINAKRVSDEFQKTGNFAEAAFKIIQEESAKAGNALTTFAEQQAALNAQIQNNQAQIGKSINEVLGYAQAFIGDLFAEGDLVLTKAYRENLKKSEKYAEDQIAINNMANKAFNDTFQQYVKEYSDADYQGRKQVLERAQEALQSLNRISAIAYGEQTETAQLALAAQAQAYQRFYNQVTKSPINLNTLRGSDIAGMSREQLTALQDQIGLGRNSLTSADKDQIKRLNELDAQVKKNLDTINGVAKATKVTKDNTKELNEELIKAKNNFKDVKDELEAYGAELDKQAKNIRTAENNLIEQLKSEFEKELLAPSLSDADAISLNSQLEQQQRDKLRRTREQERQAEIKNAIDDARRTVNIEKDKLKAISKEGDKFAIDEQKKRVKQAKLLLKEAMQPIRDERKEAFNAFLSGFQQLVSIQQTLFDNQARLLDLQYQRQSDRVNVAVELAKQGNTELLEAETKRLDEIQQKREQNAAKQLQLNAILLASQQALSVAEAIGAVTKAAAAGDPYTVALRIGAAVAALVGGIAAIKGAFKDGVIDFKGEGTGTSDSNVVRISHGESVMTAKATKQYKPYLEAMQKGTFNPYTAVMKPNNSRADYSSLETRLDNLTHAVSENRTFVTNRWNGGDLEQTVRKHAIKDKFRHRI